MVELSLFARGEDAFHLWGLIPMQRRIVGVDHAPPGPTNTRRRTAGDIMPTAFLLGADKYGRDIFSRMIYGSRISLSVGLIGITFTFLLGMTIGGISGYASGWTDVFIQRVIEILQSFPQLPLWIALAAILPDDWSALRGYFAITVLLSLLNWTGLARVVRGKILSLREEDYAVAARLLGAGHGRVLFRHLIPGFASHIIVALTLSIPGDDPRRDQPELPRAGPAPADRQLGRDAAGLPRRQGRPLLPLAARAGVLHRGHRAELQLPGRRAARRGRPVQFAMT
jgi:peptide/nickel transport system permease protein